MADDCWSRRGTRQDLRHDVKTVALHDVSFAIAAGEFASIIGQSGSGKSTLLNLIGLLDTPTTGRVVLDGHDATATGRRQRAALRNDFIGFVFQFHHLLPEFTVLENVLMPGRIAGAAPPTLVPRAEETLALLGLEGLAKKNANDLSGGQKQRVAIARALMNRPALVLADEPTGNLDTVNTTAVYELFREINARAGHRVPDRHARPRRRAADRPHPRGQRRRAAAGRAQRVLPLGRRLRPTRGGLSRARCVARPSAKVVSLFAGRTAATRARRAARRRRTGGGRSSVGRAPGCGPGGRGFESRRSPQSTRCTGRREAPAVYVKDVRVWRNW